ncbi:cob(I)yrinic acid a,c-diamide adenosyltransferase [Alienimonas californiensis]|uniref:Corrinoid adenosyltransferase n=1 Tax=Alienimonas californiensis TaxID=2527989 RepID=A0A517P8S7_9PLAN|nr:cob(I)yrinic acid a,c-diamide adenosyltransferase [Alienimonas californiensis]QDT15778.1 Cob(I)yrinic acid a,c-diamide adenosyltransferase [Alienimonas californiensis]
MRIDQVVTGGGDRGETSLADGSRVPKTDPRLAALGDVDELNAAVGLARCAAARDGAIDAPLAAVQQDLFDLGADLAVPVMEGEDDAERPPLRITAGQTERVTAAAKAAAAPQPALSSFVLPGGTELAARLHLARTVCRRAERSVWALHAAAGSDGPGVNPHAAVYLNRLSDLLFCLSRTANENGAGDVLWVPGANR